VNLVDDFNGSLVDTGGDVEGLHEVGLTWVEGGVSGWQKHVARCQ